MVTGLLSAPLTHKVTAQCGNTFCEGFLKEIDFGRVWLRLNKADKGEKDIVSGEWNDDIKSFLSWTLVRPFLQSFQQSALKIVRKMFRDLRLSLI
jgi:hypothetical protein